MTSFQIVALYVALSLVLNVVLMLRVGRGRLSKGINLGDGGDADMISRVRTHGNYIENAPLMLVGLFAVAMLSGAPLALHIFGALYLIGRLLHVFGMAGTIGQGRLLGTVLSLLCYLGMAIYIVVLIFIHGPV